MTADGRAYGNQRKREILRTLVIATGLAVVVVPGMVGAGTPFGGDDTGIISSTSTVNKCENGVGKSVGNLVEAILKCHAGRVTGKSANDAAENNCETAALAKFGATKTVGCDPCTNLAATGAAVEGLIDANNDKVYCTSAGAAFGGDDMGNVPTDAPKGPISKCENKVGKGVGKLAAGIIKCHASRASGRLADDSAEDTCEGTAITKFLARAANGCDSCTTTQSISTACSAHPTATGLQGLGNFIACAVDQRANLVYCGSPSGAFLN